MDRSTGTGRLDARRLPLLLCIVYSAMLISCGPAKEGSAAQTEGKAARTETIAPNHCRIVGTIVSVDSTLDLSDTSNPCSRYPCRATVRVDSMLGYGMAFPHPLPSGSRIPVTFLFTLHPGLSIGTQFRADVLAVEGIAQTGQNPPAFSIAGYTVVATH